jgi:hypothetical protein
MSIYKVQIHEIEGLGITGYKVPSDGLVSASVKDKVLLIVICHPNVVLPDSLQSV